MSNNIDSFEAKSRYPLQWPDGYPRTEQPQRSQFDTPFGRARDNLVHQLQLLGKDNNTQVGNVIISSNISLRKADGMPYANFAPPDDKGVAVYFMWHGEMKVLACDKWDRVRDNIHALELTIKAIRGQDRWGVSDFINQTFQGFLALPAGGSGKPWWEVLRVDYGASAAQVRTAYRRLAKKYHPDNPDTGNEGLFHEVQEAFQQFHAVRND